MTTRGTLTSVGDTQWIIKDGQRERRLVLRRSVPIPAPESLRVRLTLFENDSAVSKLRSELVGGRQNGGSPLELELRADDESVFER